MLDAHQHFWKYDPARHGWINESMAAIRRDFMPPDLWKELEANGMEGCITVQVDQTEDETFFCLDLAEKFDFIKGVVGWVDIRSPKLEARLDYLTDYKKLCGFRHIVQAEPDPLFLLNPTFVKGISLLGRYHFTYDILIYPHQLPAALELVKKFPEQKFVIDHLAKPYIKEGYYQGWATMMKEIGRFENVHCKVSGMVTEANWNSWKYEDFVPYLDLVFNTFGTKRIFYGSDWPVCLVAASYRSQMNIVERFTDLMTKTEKQDIFGNSAERFYLGRL